MVDNKSILEAAKCAHSAVTSQHKTSTFTTMLSNETKNENPTEYFRRIQENIWWRYLLAGGVAGGISRTMTAPLDRLKIYTQVHSHSMSLYKLLKFLVHSGGVLSLWRGNSVNCMKIIPESAVKFTVYEKLKRLMLGTSGRELSIHERFLAGSSAAGFAQSLVYPLEVLKTRLALGLSSQALGIRTTARNMYKHEGLRSFYRGYLPNFLGSVPYGGIEFTIYEALKRRYKKSLALGDEPSLLILSLCSSVSATIGQCCVYPFSLVRTRLQSGLMGNAKIYCMFRHIIVCDGLKGLYRGLVPNIYKVVPAVSINFVIYEYVSRHLGIQMS